MADDNRMNRRGILKICSAAGLGAGYFAVNGQFKSVQASSDSDDMVKRLWGWRASKDNRDREPIYYMISRDKWRQVESAHDARRQIENKIQKSFGIENPTVGVTSVESPNDKIIEVRNKTFDDGQVSHGLKEFNSRVLRESLPKEITGVAGRNTQFETEVTGIPVTVREVTVRPNYYFDNEYRPVPGGCKYEFEDSCCCTIGTPAYDNKYNQDVIVTAQHCFMASPDIEVHQPDYSNLIGEYDRGKFVEDFDAAIVSMNSDVTYQIALQTGYGDDVYGIVSRTRLKDLEGENERLTKQGITTGRKSGTISYVSENEVEILAWSAGGDSGGPYWEEIPEELGGGALIAAIHHGKDVDSGNPIGTIMEAIEEEYLVEVNPNA